MEFMLSFSRKTKKCLTLTHSNFEKVMSPCHWLC